MKELFPRCSICGRFINMATDKYITEFIPDTEFSVEEIIFTHKECLEKESQ